MYLARLVPIFIGALLGPVHKPFFKSKLKIDIKWNIALLFILYRVFQQVSDMPNVTFWSSEKFASEASYGYKIDPIKRGEIRILTQ